MSYSNDKHKEPKNTNTSTNPNTTSTVYSSVFSPLQSEGTTTTTTTPRDPHGATSKKLLPTTTHKFLQQLASSTANSKTSLNSSEFVESLSKPMFVNLNRGTRGDNIDSSNKDVSLDESSLSDLSQLEDAVEFYEVKGNSANFSYDTKLSGGTPSRGSRPVSIFKELDDLDQPSDKRASVNKLLEIYTEVSPSSVREKSARESNGSAKENAFSFLPSSSASLISNNRKLDTKVHYKAAKAPLKDVSNGSSDESANISSSTSNFYRDNSTVSTHELLNALMNDPPQTKHKRSSSHYTLKAGDQGSGFKDSLTNILEDHSYQPKGIIGSTKHPIAPLNDVYKGKSPPTSIPSSVNISRAPLLFQSNKNQNMNIYTVQQTQHDTHSQNISEDRFIPVKPVHDSSSSSNDSFHSFQEVDYGVITTNKGNNITIDKDKEKFQMSDSDGSYPFENMLPPSQYEENFCPKKTSRILILCSLIIPPFYLLIALGVLDHKIGKIDRRHRFIAGILSIVGTLLILMAVGLGFGYGLTHL